MPVPDTTPIRRRLDLRGQVQGVGFRPFVYRLAATRGLGGYVANSSTGAVVEVEGPAAALAAFEQELLQRLPPLARITTLARIDLPPVGEATFRIRPSQPAADQRPEVTPDAATCPDCLRELLDTRDRRYRYPFINCTNCGPRYSIIRSVPYDRPGTTMAAFIMCPACAREYADPADRRFHAQPNACPACGPQVALRPPPGRHSAASPATAAALPHAAHQAPPADPIRAAARLLADGAILAVKGIGGYHLACRADREDVVQRLRQRKLRDGKPLALMVPDLATAARIARLDPADVDALTSAAAPIVLVRQRPGHGLAPSVAPGCRDFGLMLPYAPLHHLLFAEGLGPLVMTSANRAGQPLTYRDDDARAELGDVADAFLVHDREICRPIDDSVVLTFRDEVVPIRRARGYAPRPIRLAGFDPGGPLAGVRGRRILAVGGELKSAACLLTAGTAVLSEHLGDLTTPEAYRHFVRAVERLKDLCGFVPDAVACDRHPRYLASAYARGLGLPLVGVQHHHAHIASTMAEWGETGPLIGVACDGTGFGPDGAVWGGEVLLCERSACERVGHLAYFPLVGGDAAALETWRPAAALLRAAEPLGWRDRLAPPAGARGALPAPAALDVFERQAAGGLNAPPTSSLGRHFDAVSFLLGLCPRNRHEAEAAMALEAAAAAEPPAVEPLAWEIVEDGGLLRLSLLPAIRELVAARDAGAPAARLAARFHETAARVLAEAAVRAGRARGLAKVALSGGCFANRRLLHRLVELLESAGFGVLYPRQVPAGDGGLALGQALVAAWTLAGQSR